MIEYKIEILTSVNSKNLEDINRLVLQLQPDRPPLTAFYLQELIKSSYNFFYVVKNQEDVIIGMALFTYYLLLIGVKKAWFEDLVVDQNYRGQGIGGQLLKTMYAKAKELQIDVIELTSNPARIAANALYQKFGFKPYQTNCYKMYLQKS
jgi:GNAT superfamily N-acetyltransferase